ncbi:MAG: hypothetical protein WBB22_15995 [Anaerolineae bacterium]
MRRIKATDTSPQMPLGLGLECNVSVHIRGEALSPGGHEIAIRFVTSEVGKVRLAVRDSVEG